MAPHSERTRRQTEKAAAVTQSRRAPKSTRSRPPKPKPGGKGQSGWLPSDVDSTTTSEESGEGHGGQHRSRHGVKSKNLQKRPAKRARQRSPVDEIDDVDEIQDVDDLLEEAEHVVALSSRAASVADVEDDGKSDVSLVYIENEL